MRHGILAGGNWIVDRVKIIDVWPQQDALANIRETSISNGGGPYNVLVDLRRLGFRASLEAVGALGDDLDADWILEDCARYGIGTEQLRRTPGAQTSMTDVMTVAATGRRTFFHQRGANACLDVDAFDFEASSAKHFHLGYLLLLDRLDQHDPEFGTRAGRVLASARAKGIRTSFDVVSEDSDRFPQVVLPTLPYADVAFMNEFELGRCTGLTVSDDQESVWAAATRLFTHGLGELAVVHMPAGGFALHRGGDRWFVRSVPVPANEIAGTAGAGDAFAAGFLASYHDGHPTDRCLQAAVNTAALSLRHVSCSQGIPWA